MTSWTPSCCSLAACPMSLMAAGLQVRRFGRGSARPGELVSSLHSALPLAIARAQVNWGAGQQNTKQQQHNQQTTSNQQTTNKQQHNNNTINKQQNNQQTTKQSTNMIHIKLFRKFHAEVRKP
eukprot:15956139-Heterocapsa_arctica.AAC.1